jgi:septin family protein
VGRTLSSFESTPESHKEAGVRLKAHTYELQESNVNLKLTLVDTVGYGDQINKEDSFRSIVDYIDNQFEAYLQASHPRILLKLFFRIPGPGWYSTFL